MRRAFPFPGPQSRSTTPLTPQQYRARYPAIWSLARRGFSARWIARKLGLSHQRVSTIIRRATREGQR